MRGINLKGQLYTILLVIFSITFILIYIITFSQNNNISKNNTCLAKIETVSSGMQRVSKLELEKSPDNEILKELEYIINYELFSNNIANPNFFEDEPEMLAVIENVFNDWSIFYNAVLKFREDDKRDELFQVSELKYESLNKYISLIKEYNTNLENNYNKLNQFLIFNVIIIALLLLKILANTISELQKNKELSKDMFIDTSTGLYNRSKCQEILKSEVKNNVTKERAVIVCDLNGLKKTNDEFGHRAGDQLISCFANELKNATNIFPYKVFVGRYGGDEFIVYFENIEEHEVKSYIKEVNFLMEQFNDTQNKPFKLACAIGYAITTPKTKDIKTRELFDIADEDMYKNKIAMKAKQQQKLKEQGLEIKEEQDDRL